MGTATKIHRCFSDTTVSLKAGPVEKSQLPSSGAVSDEWPGGRDFSTAQLTYKNVTLLPRGSESRHMCARGPESRHKALLESVAEFSATLLDQ